jgi:DNA-binding PadR family transcriptional regulator
VARGGYLGDFEHLVLLAVLRCGDNAYGLPIRDEIVERTGRAASTGAVYATLERLERKGLLASRVTPGGVERDHRPRRIYDLTGAAFDALAETRAAIAAMSRGLRLPGAR